MKLAESIIEELWFAEDKDEKANAEASKSLAIQLARSDGLKTFPVVAQKVLTMFINDNYRISEVTRALEEDPSLASGVLRMANSAFFAPVHPITDINQAFMRIGARHVKEIVCALSTMNMFKNVTGLGLLIRNHCASTAGLGIHLARAFAPMYTEGLFLAGLLHDIGKLMLIDSAEIDYPEEDPKKTLIPDTMHLFERQRLGYDHAVLAGHIVSDWNFGEDLSRLIAWHHQPTRSFEKQETSISISLLRLADHIDYLLYIGKEDYTSIIKELHAGPECTNLNIKEADLQAIWPDLYTVRMESLTTFASAG